MTRAYLCDILVLAVTCSAAAQVPDSLSYQGCLTSAGAPVADGPHTIEFRLFDHPTAGSEVWTETQSLSTQDCVFDTYLGKISSLASVPFDKRLWLAVEASGSGTVLMPRTPLTSAPFALGVRNLRILPVENSEYRTVNLIGGYIGNEPYPGIVGATIGGGGGYFKPGPGSDDFNIVRGDFGTIGGGVANEAYLKATVAGGEHNNAGGENATVSGGSYNFAEGANSVVAGGVGNEARGNYSFAAGGGATVEQGHHGTFVWAGYSGEGSGIPAFGSTGPDQFLIRAAGGVGIGTNAPAGQLAVSSGENLARPQVSIEQTNATDYARLRMRNGASKYWEIQARSESDDDFVIYHNTAGDLLRIQTTRGLFGATFMPFLDNSYNLGGPSNRWVEVWAVEPAINTSDARWKTAIRPLDYGLAEVLRLRPVSFEWRDRPGSGTRLGLLAQEVEPVIPEVVVHPEEGALGARYTELIPVLVKAIQEQQTLIETLQTENREIRARLRALEP